MKASPGRSVIFILISLLILANASCNKTGEAKKTRIAFVTNNTSNFWTYARRGTEKAKAELPNVEIEFKINSETTAAGQQRIVDDLLAKGVDGIAISPVDPQNQTQLINRAAKQALVFTQDSDAPQSERACYIGTDNTAAGRQAGELVKYPDISGMVGLWAYNGPAILGAVKEAGKIGKVKIVTFDEEDETLAGIKEGAIHATVVQQPFQFGYQSMIKLAKAIGGDKSGIPPSKQDIVPTLAIKKDGVDDFIVRLNKLRGVAK